MEEPKIVSLTAERMLRGKEPGKMAMSEQTNAVAAELLDLLQKKAANDNYDENWVTELIIRLEILGNLLPQQAIEAESLAPLISRTAELFRKVRAGLSPDSEILRSELHQLEANLKGLFPFDVQRRA